MIKKINFKGTGGNKKPENAKQIWDLSAEKNNLQYTEFHGDSGGERYKTVWNTYPTMKWTNQCRAYPEKITLPFTWFEKKKGLEDWVN